MEADSGSDGDPASQGPDDGRGWRGTCSCSACAFAVTSAFASAFDAKSPALKSSSRKSAKRGSLSKKPASAGGGLGVLPTPPHRARSAGVAHADGKQIDALQRLPMDVDCHSRDYRALAGNGVASFEVCSSAHCSGSFCMIHVDTQRDSCAASRVRPMSALSLVCGRVRATT